ncbi:MAG TPA: response regulator [Candidatus Baltobacteraceae bacterium]|nr:response regulator [Candidatus Baltobacteraceae bacterium]
MARILVVDDNASNRELMMYLLRAFGHDPHGVKDGLAGLEAMRAGAFDIVLSDVLMPHMGGFEFLRRLRADPQLAGCKVVAVTASAMVGDRESTMKSGFDGYIAKPIDPEKFVGQVDSYLSMGLRSSKPWRPS